MGRLQEAEKEADELKGQMTKQADELIQLRKVSKRTKSLERGAPDAGKVAKTRSIGLAFEPQSNPSFKNKFLTLHFTPIPKSPSAVPQSDHSPDQLTKRQTAISHRSNPASPYRDMYPSKARLSPATDRRHIRVASDRISKVSRLRTGLRH